MIMDMRRLVLTADKTPAISNPPLVTSDAPQVTPLTTMQRKTNLTNNEICAVIQFF